jgi:hypothetical protein
MTEFRTRSTDDTLVAEFMLGSEDDERKVALVSLITMCLGCFFLAPDFRMR